MGENEPKDTVGHAEWMLHPSPEPTTTFIYACTKHLETLQGEEHLQKDLLLPRLRSCGNLHSEMYLGFVPSQHGCYSTADLHGCFLSAYLCV